MTSAVALDVPAALRAPPSPPTLEELAFAAGTDKSRLLTAQIWLKDIDTDFKAMNGVWNNWVDPNAKPARATVQSPMARPVVLVEIQATAAMP